MVGAVDDDEATINQKKDETRRRNGNHAPTYGRKVSERDERWEVHYNTESFGGSNPGVHGARPLGYRAYPPFDTI